jgi:hypothetical protein
MAIRHDYLERIEERGEETVYVDLVLVGHAFWVRGERGPSPPVAAGNLLGVISVHEGRYFLNLSDDEFTLVDGKIATLAERLREIIQLEYQNLWQGRYWSLAQEAKWYKIGLKRTAYSQRLTGAQWALHQVLLPDIKTWRERTQQKRERRTLQLPAV